MISVQKYEGTVICMSLKILIIIRRLILAVKSVNFILTFRFGLPNLNPLRCQRLRMIIKSGNFIISHIEQKHAPESEFMLSQTIGQFLSFCISEA